VNYTEDAMLDSAAEYIVQYVHEIETSGKAKKPLLGPLAGVDTRKTVALINKKADENVEGTRLWILEDVAKFVASNKQVLVILGSAGIGKSVLLAFICQIGSLFDPEEVFKILATSKGDEKHRSSRIGSMVRAIVQHFSWGKLRGLLDVPIVAAFAFKHDDIAASSAKTALLSICKQMLDTVPYYAEEVTGALVDFDVTQKDINTIFEELIVQPLNEMDEKQRSPEKRASVIIDALDECDGKQRGDFIRVLLVWQERVPKWLKQICSSRPAEFVIPGVDGLKQKPMEIDADGLANMQDMKLYLSKELSLYMPENSRERDEAVEVLAEKSEGSFLYADFFKTILKEVSETEGGVTLAKIKSADSFPFGIDGMYQIFFLRFLQAVLNGDKDLYQALLGPMCFSREPIPMEVIQKLLGIEDEDEFLLLQTNMQELLVVTHGFVRFVHKSMADWLPNRGRNLNRDLLVKPAAAKKLLARFCFENCSKSEFAARNAVYQIAVAKDFEGVANLLCNYDKLHGIIITQKYPARQFVRDCEEHFTERVDFLDAELVVRAIEKGLNGISRDVRELPGQLASRLPPEHPVAQVLNGLKLGFRYLRAQFEGKMIQADGPLRKTLAGHKDIVYDLALRGDVVITTSRDLTAKVFSKDTGEVLKSVKVGTGPYCIDADESIVATGMHDFSIKIWSFETGDPVQWFKTAKNR